MRAVLAALAATIALSGAVVSSAAKPVRTIYVRNTSAFVTDAEVRDALPAFQEALNKDFAPIWHTRARLVFIGARMPPPGAERIQLVDFPNCFFCAGFHAMTHGGTVYSEIGVAPVLGDWHITFSHELWEQLVDPYADDYLLKARSVTYDDGTKYLVETADPVEAPQFAYIRLSRSRRPIAISDFVTPAWFDPSSRGFWDFTGHVRRPLQILKGGYQIVWRDGEWNTINNFNQVVDDEREAEG